MFEGFQEGPHERLIDVEFAEDFTPHVMQDQTVRLTPLFWHKNYAQYRGSFW